MKCNIPLIKYLLPVVLMFLNGCKMMTPLPAPTSLQAPRTFLERMDSSSVGGMTIRNFFTDSYLVALLDTALIRNPDLAVAQQRIAQARADLQERSGALWPTVDAEISGGVRRFGEYTMDGVGNYDTNFSDNINPDQRMTNPLPDYFVGARSTWEADIWGKLRTRRKAAYLRFLATENGRQLVQTTLVADIARLYYELLTLDNQLEIIQRNAVLQQQALETIIIQKEGGRANELAVRQFAAQLLNTQSLEIQIRQQILEIETRINTLMGRFSQPIVRGNPILDQKLPQSIGVGIPAEMLRRRPDVQQAELELKANQEELQAARLSFLPSLNITAYTGLNAFRSAVLLNPGSLAFGLLGGLTAPILNRQALRANQNRAQARSLEALYSYNKTILEAYQESALLMGTIDNLKKISALKTQETSELQQGVSISNDLYLAGYASYLEVITAQRSVLSAELEQTTIRQREFSALIDLYRSLGGGWE
ncbi:TolC family protein [Arundinibacter roseus]|uniref:TolC family protein n=2 Tax=Arundinibacter roseus TaxID=2070510 RepID=A0A4R4KPU4_9BACT|nr:TolC family protein [Arundinibacter roseus]